MDDMLIFDNNNYIIKSIKKILTNKFDLKYYCPNLGHYRCCRCHYRNKKNLGHLMNYYCPNLFILREILNLFFKTDNSMVITLIEIFLNN
jgi:hypothetical protein